MDSIQSKEFNLTNYIKAQLDDKSDNYGVRREKKNKCLKEIGMAMNEYLDYEKILVSMSDSSIRELKNAISRIRFSRKSFTKFITCQREEAAKDETELRSKGYFTYGEYGGDYGYFQHKSKLTEQQKEWFNEHIECCYYHGQPCGVWQKEEPDSWDEDCECRLGREYSSLVVYELDEEEEKRLGVWKQDIVWSLNGYGDININHYYSLEKIKKDALEEYEQENDCNGMAKILSYLGKKDLNIGNINIKVINNN
jgi:hypothetical protein